MESLVAQPELVGDGKVCIRQHERLQTVRVAPIQNLIGMIHANGDNLNAAFVELRPKFFPSPQLGDAVRSPVPPEELDQGRVAHQGRRIESLAPII